MERVVKTSTLMHYQFLSGESPFLPKKVKLGGVNAKVDDYVVPVLGAYARYVRLLKRQEIVQGDASKFYYPSGAKLEAIESAVESARASYENVKRMNQITVLGISPSIEAILADAPQY